MDWGGVLQTDVHLIGWFFLLVNQQTPGRVAAKICSVKADELAHSAAGRPTGWSQTPAQSMLVNYKMQFGKMVAIAITPIINGWLDMLVEDCTHTHTHARTHTAQHTEQHSTAQHNTRMAWQRKYNRTTISSSDRIGSRWGRRCAATSVAPPLGISACSCGNTILCNCRAYSHWYIPDFGNKQHCRNTTACNDCHPFYRCNHGRFSTLSHTYSSSHIDTWPTKSQLLPTL